MASNDWSKEPNPSAPTPVSPAIDLMFSAHGLDCAHIKQKASFSDRDAACSQPEPQPSPKAFQEGGRRRVWCVFGLIGDGCGDGAVILQM